MKNNDLPKIDPVIIENMEYPLPKQPNRFFQLLSNAGDKIGDVGGTVKNKMADILIGREVAEPETIITDEGIQSGINNGGRQGGVVGFLGDMSKGAKENMANSFSPMNLAPAKKGFGYRLGEALGTGARLLDNSLVRGALAYGLSKYNGDYNPLEQGLIALGTNMQNKTADRLYRQDLASSGIDASNIRGFIDNNTYGNLIRSQQIRDNAEWRKLQNETMQDMRNREFEYRKKQDAIENALRARGIEIQENRASGNKKNLSNLEAVSNQLARFEETFKTMPGKIESNTLGRLRNATGFQTPNEANFNSQRTLLFNKIARDLGGEKGVLSDQDIKRIEASLPNYTDSLEQKNAKMQAIYDLLEDRLNVEGASLNTKTQQNSNTTSATFVQMKAPNGRIYNVPIEDVEEMKKQGGVVING